MKNKVLYIIIGVVLVLILGGVAKVLSLNTEKESMTASGFKTMMEGKGFTVSDATSQFAEFDYIKQAYVAVSSDYSYKIEFYELSNDEYATGFYNNNKEIFKSSKDNASIETSVALKNYAKYNLTTGKQYKVVSRIDNTVIYLNVDLSDV